MYHKLKLKIMDKKYIQIGYIWKDDDIEKMSYEEYVTNYGEEELNELLKNERKEKIEEIFK